MPVYKNSDYISVMRPLPNDWPKDQFGIPYIKKEHLPFSRINTDLFLINPKNISSKDKYAKNKIVHSFSYDSILKSEYDNPFRFMHKISGYYGICSPDFSMHESMETWQIIQAIGTSRWLGAFLQSHGLKVYTKVGWINPDTYDICFSGIEDGSTLFISTLGVKNKECETDFLNGLSELRKRFPNSKQICVGSKIRGIPNDVCMVSYEESFGSQNKGETGLQGKIFNWDLSINKEVI